MIKRPERTASGVAKRFGLLALIATVLVALLGFLAPTASASPTFHPQTRVAAIEQPTGQLVAPHSLVLAVQGRERAPNYDRSATGSSVAAEEIEVDTEELVAARDAALGANDPLGKLAAEVPEGNPATGQNIGEGGTTLYRAVEPGELSDIEASGTYRVPEGIGEGKYFYPTEEQAANFAEINPGRAYTLTSSQFPEQVLRASWYDTIGGEGPAYFIPSEYFPHGPVGIGGPLP